MSTIDSSWISTATRERLETEVAQLYRDRDLVSAELIEHRNMGDLDNNDAYHRSVSALDQINTRIARTHTLLASASTITVDDGTVQPGSIVTVQFDDDASDTETFLLGLPEEHGTGQMQVCSPDSPLGKAVRDSRVGEVRQYRLPNGSLCSATVLAITPYTA